MLRRLRRHLGLVAELAAYATWYVADVVIALGVEFGAWRSACWSWRSC
jgi:hypothetical protein